MKARLLSRLEVAVLPQHVRTRERRMTAEIDFDRRREPAEIVAVASLHEKGGFGEVHLARDVEHPRRLGGLGEDADCGRIACEGSIRESINLRDPEAHASKSIAIGPNGRVVAARTSRLGSPERRR